MSPLLLFEYIVAAGWGALCVVVPAVVAYLAARGALREGAKDGN